MQLAVEEAAGAELTLDDVVAIHRALLEDGPDTAIAGQIRAGQSWIGGNDYNPCGAAFVPPAPEEVEPLLADLVAFCNDQSVSPLVQAALAHAQFETIHPFDDGNGRTGRALVQVLLRRRGLAPAYVPPISVVLAADRDRYIGGLTAFREGRENDWLESFAVAAAWLLVDELPAHPIISVPIAAAVTRRTKPAVNQAVAQLVEAGVLVQLGEGRRNRLWEAEGLLDLLAALEAAEPLARSS